MTARQLAGHHAGILAHATRLKHEGVPFSDYRVGQVLDSAFLLKRQGVTDWEETYNAILRMFGELAEAA